MVLDNFKRSVEKFNQESAAASRKLLDKENQLKHDEETITELRSKIPNDERELIAEKQELRRAEGEKGRLVPEISQLKREEATLHNKATQALMEQNRILRSANARDPHEHGAQLKELKQKPRFGLN